MRDIKDYYLGEKEFNVDEYLKDIKIDSINSFDLLKELGYLYKNKNIVLNDERVRNKLHNFFNDAGTDQYSDYEFLFSVIDVEYFFNLFTYDEIKEYFKNNEYLNIYKLYATMCKNDINKLIDKVISNDEMFINFLEEINKFYSAFCNVDYDYIVKFIKKVDNYINDIQINYYYFLSGIRDEDQLRILDEDISEDMKIAIIDNMIQENKDEFLSNDKRALYLYNKLQINTIIRSKLNDNIIEDKNFMNKIQDYSLVTMRNRVNSIASNNDDVIIEDKFSNWENELINDIDLDTGIFNYYIEAFNKVKENIDNIYGIDFGNLYLNKVNFMEIIKKNVHYDNGQFILNDDNIMKELRDTTNYKLSELIIDYLFRDNIYNVWLNIKEIIRYDDSVKDKTISIDKLNFYKDVLNIDNMSINDKIEFYNKYKDKKVYEDFYDDIRNSKNDAYNIIKNKLINIDKHSDYRSDSLSMEHGTDVYDLRDKEYYMLVRNMYSFDELHSNARNCYSIINNNKTDTFHENDGKLYGYNSFDIDYILHMNEEDAYSYSISDADEASKYVNRIMTPEQITNVSTFYNEIEIINKLSNNKYDNIKPDFIVCKDDIRHEDVLESDRLHIPIVLIKSKELTRDNTIDIGEKGGFDRNTYIQESKNDEETLFEKRKR